FTSSGARKPGRVTYLRSSANVRVSWKPIRIQDRGICSAFSEGAEPGCLSPDGPRRFSQIDQIRKDVQRLSFSGIAISKAGGVIIVQCGFHRVVA
ncbi:MAG: hypothetical protein QOE88_498, partial [Verrucomicrobiota bacterium]|nr:hypothetical protein [Verrucomicrobiota bacterium]